MKERGRPKRKRVTAVKVVLGLVILFVAIEIAALPFPWTVAGLRTHNPSQTALMKERMSQAKAKHRPFRIRQSFVPLSRISDAMVHAVVVGEDGTFYENDGVDWYEVQQSFDADWRAKKIVRGSSTITMQLAKNLWFSTSRDPLTKLNEMLSAFMLTHYLTKNRIMELYLNYIEFERGIFGIQAASRVYFGEPASQLTRDQAARLAAIIPDPLGFIPLSGSRFVSYRTNIILVRMGARGW